MGKKGFTSYSIGDQNALHFLTFATVGWIDVFTRKSYKDILIESLKYCQEQKGLELYCYVIMTNHVHLVVRAKEGFKLSDIYFFDFLDRPTIKNHQTFTFSGFVFCTSICSLDCRS